MLRINPASSPFLGAAARYVILAVVALLFIVLIFPAFLGGRGRPSPVSRVRADLRAISAAIETYVVDEKALPPWSAKLGQNVFTVENEPDQALYNRIPTFVRPVPGGIASMTTPIAYMKTVFFDPFSPGAGQSYAYWNNDNYAMTWSAGPDRKYDLTMDNLAQACDPNREFPSDELVNSTYDPSNGSVSNGDLYRLSAIRNITMRKDIPHNPSWISP